MNFIWNHLKSHKKLLFLTLVLATINQVFSLLDPQIFRLIIDNYASKASTLSSDVFFKGIGLLLLAGITVALISRIAKNFQDYYVSVITQRIGTSMYSKSVQHTFSLPYEVFEDRRSGEILQKLQKARLDTQVVISSFINTLFLSVVGVLFVVGYALTVHWSIGLTYFLIIPILGTFMFFISKKIKDAQKLIVKESAELAGSTTETIRNVELVKSLGLEDQEIQRLNAVNNKILQLELKKIRIIRKLSFIQGTLVNALRSAVLLLMLYLIYTGNVSLGQFLTLFIYSFFIFSPLADLGNVISQYQEAKASNEQLNEILKLEPQKKSPNSVKIEKVDSIKFEKIGFRYSSGKSNSLNNINLSIKSGESVAFVGPSGSGKTTIVKLLVGLYEPSEGKLFVNSHESKTIDYDLLRRKIGLVSQETQLFAGTIRENLLFVNPKATDKECIEVLEMASVSTLIQRGDKGLNNKIGEGGIKISGGERQRLAIARALLRNPEIIIFDEATSSLDSITEKSIIDTIKDIRKLRPELIIIMIAHRLSTVIDADTIHVLEKGNVIESGNHQSLLKKKGLYYAFWREQIASED